jgi:hypothetical protein
MVPSRRITSLVGWRWLPFFALTGAALLYAMVVPALVPDELPSLQLAASAAASGRSAAALVEAEPEEPEAAPTTRRKTRPRAVRPRTHAEDDPVEAPDAPDRTAGADPARAG